MALPEFDSIETSTPGFQNVVGWRLSPSGWLRKRYLKYPPTAVLASVKHVGLNDNFALTAVQQL